MRGTADLALMVTDLILGVVLIARVPLIDDVVTKVLIALIGVACLTMFVLMADKRWNR